MLKFCTQTIPSKYSCVLISQMRRPLYCMNKFWFNTERYVGLMWALCGHSILIGQLFLTDMRQDLIH